MTTPSTFRTLLRRTWLPTLALIVMAFFGGYAVLGTNGILAYGEYKHQLAAQQARYAGLDKQRAVLKNRVALLDPGTPIPTWSTNWCASNSTLPALTRSSSR